MTGCDYLANIKGIGFKTIISIYFNKNQKKELMKLLSKKHLIDMTPDEYLESVEKTMIGFQHPLIFDKNRQLSYLNINHKLSESECQNLNFFVGPKFHDFEKFCDGKVDIKTMKPRNAVDVDFKRICEFLDYVPNNSCGRLNNLCSRLITFENFDRIEPSVKSHDTKDNSVNIEVSNGTKRIKKDPYW